jgi:predicted Holliday junction resolvase-like endonuclease
MDADPQKKSLRAKEQIMSIEWAIIVIIIVAMYIIIYKYEKKMDRLQKHIEENRSKIEENHSKIMKNHTRIDEHYNHLEKMWITIPELHPNAPSELKDQASKKNQ